MRRTVVSSLVLFAVTFCSLLPVDAAGPGGGASFKKKSWFTKTVTTSVYSAPLAPDINAGDFDSSATGLAEYKVVTVDITFCGNTWSSTCRSLTISLSNLPTLDVDTVTYEINEDESNEIPLTVLNGSVSYRISTKCGGTVPGLVEGDAIDFDGTISNEEWDLLGGVFGAPVITVSTCGK